MQNELETELENIVQGKVENLARARVLENKVNRTIFMGSIAKKRGKKGQKETKTSQNKENSTEKGHRYGEGATVADQKL